MKRFLLTHIILLICCCSSFGQQKEIIKVAAAAEILRMAMINADSTALSNITTDSLSYGHSGGKIESKAEFINKIISGRSDFVSIDISEQTIRIIGRTAIIRHNFNAVTNDGGKPGTVKLSVLQVWVKEKYHWKLAARQAVKL